MSIIYLSTVHSHLFIFDIFEDLELLYFLLYFLNDLLELSSNLDRPHSHLNFKVYLIGNTFCLFLTFF